MADMSDAGAKKNVPPQAASEDEPGLKISRREEEIRRFWKGRRIFERSLEQTKKGKPFVFYEGPPTANGSPGIHHFEARAFKDIILRFRTMQGFFVARKAGWDTHGLPVEIQVEKELGLKTKRDIERYGIAAFNKKCRESVWRYKEEWDNFTRRMAFWLDLDHPYITYETPYIETLWWIIKELWKKKMLYQDFKIVPWCPRCQTGLSTHEVGQGYKSVEDRSVYVKFYLPRLDAFILSWTTTPWTLPGNVALAVSKDLRYVRVRYRAEANRDEFYILAKDRISVLDKSRIVYEEEMPPARLIGEEYQPLFEVANLRGDRSYRVYAADFVSAAEGTGVVHTAVMYGDDDYRLGKEIGLPRFHTVDETGHFIPELGEGLGGQRAKDPKTEEKIIASLRSRGFLYKEELHEHEYPHCWRCETPLLYYARQGWWVKMSAVKKQLLAGNEKISWVPDYLKHGRFGEFLKDVRDWAFSRERYWGTPLPIWQCGTCHQTEVIGGADELKKKGRPENRYFLMRHGESEAMMLGISDDDEKSFHLTPAGEKQVSAAALKLKKMKIGRIYASPIQRVRETAQIVARVLGAEAVYDERLREIHIGVFEHQHPDRYHSFYSSTLEKFHKRPPEGENLNDVKARLIAAIADFEKKNSGENILIITHEYPAWILWGAGQGLSDAAMAQALDQKKDAFIKPAGIMPLSYTLLPRNEAGDVDLHRPYVDEFSFSCKACGGAMKRVPEVADVWFDSGAMPFAQHHFPFEKKTGLPYPADYICEAIDQTRGWFYTLLAVATALGRGAPYRNVISLGHVLDKRGQKMSKTKGNVVDPNAMIRKYGADAIRWYFYTVNGPGDPKRFDERDLLLKLRGPLATLWNSFVFFDTYVPAGSVPDGKAGKPAHALDQWIGARLDELIVEMTGKLERYDVVGAARAFEHFAVDDFSNWYLRRSRRRFQKPESAEAFSGAARAAGAILLRLSELAAPFMPFLSEAIFSGLREKVGLPDESVHLRPWPKAQKAGTTARILADEMRAVRAFAAETLRSRAERGIKVRQPLAELRIKRAAFKHPGLAELLQDEVNVKKITFDPKIEGEIELDATVTPELREEGLVRELIRNIQEMRKDAGLKPGDEIFLRIEGSARFERWRDLIRREAGAKEILSGSKGRAFAVERRMDLDGEIIVGIEKTRIGRRRG